MKKNFKEYLSIVKAFVFDVDGVFTDGSLLLLESGQMARSMNIRDGFAVKHAVEQGYPVAIITGGDYEPVRDRFERLGVKNIYIASKDKVTDYKQFLNKYELATEGVMYMGDDMPDYDVMHIVGVPTCPLNADKEIKKLSYYVSDKNGGEGCVRDVIEQVLRAQENWIKK